MRISNLTGSHWNKTRFSTQSYVWDIYYGYFAEEMKCSIFNSFISEGVLKRIKLKLSWMKNN